MATTDPSGIQFVADGSGQRSSTAAGRSILAAALQPLDADAADACRAERRWRQAYPQHVRALVERQAAAPGATVASCRAGLDAAWAAVEVVAGAQRRPLHEAMASASAGAFETLRALGRGDPAPARWEVPLRGRRLHGDALARLIDDWCSRGVIEPSCAAALHAARTHPEWFDLSDRQIVLLGAGSEAGPLGWFASWRANVVAVDLARGPTWKRIAETMLAGNGTLTAPVAAGTTLGGDAGIDLNLAGADLLTQAPQVAAWLASLGAALDVGCIAYADGEKHVRLTLAMDAIAQALCRADARTTLAWMATPTDVFAVPETLASAVMAAYEHRGVLRRLAQEGLRAGSGGRSFAPHVERLIDAPDGSRRGVVDALVVEQGPNYALAKRLQQWRAIVARDAGHAVSIRVAPSTTTASVVSNPALAAGFRGAKAFDVEVFEPETTNALMSALWVHDLRNPAAVAAPPAHPLDPLVDGAAHGGLWRVPHLPRSVLPFAALLGLMKRR